MDLIKVFYRAIIMYLLVFAVIRLSGKRQLSQIQPFDLVMSLIIADLASYPISEPNIPITYGIVPIIGVFIVQKLIAFSALKMEWVRTVVCGNPLVIIKNGVVMESTMRKANYSMQDLLENLRILSVFNISDVQYAILETGGNLSVLTKSNALTVTREDMNIKKNETCLSHALIIDGKIIKTALKDSSVSESWLKRYLKNSHIQSPSQVLFAELEDGKTLQIQTKAQYGSKTYTIKTDKGN